MSPYHLQNLPTTKHFGVDVKDVATTMYWSALDDAIASAQQCYMTQKNMGIQIFKTKK